MKKLKRYQYERYAILCQLAYSEPQFRKDNLNLNETSPMQYFGDMSKRFLSYQPSTSSSQYNETLRPFYQRDIIDKYSRKSVRILWREQKNEVIVVFRGSLGIRDWLGNLCFFPSKLKLHGANYYLHWGFKRLLFQPMYSSHKNLQQALPLNELLMLVLTPLQQKGKRFTFIGHSTGGSVASIFADIFERKFPKSVKRVVTFGQPASGTVSFRRRYLLNQKTYRICCDLDIVTFMPPIPYMYWHVGKLLWLHDDTIYENTPTHIRLLRSLKSWVLRPITYHFMKKYIRNKTLFDEH